RKRGCYDRPARPHSTKREERGPMRPMGIFCLLATSLATMVPQASHAARPRHESVGRQYFQSPQSNPIALSPDGSRLYVAATTSNQVDVTATGGARGAAQHPSA